jgi:hypothetical protein
MGNENPLVTSHPEDWNRQPFTREISGGGFAVVTSALPPKADIGERNWDVRFVPIADIHGAVQITQTIMSIITVAIVTGPSILVDGAIGLRQRNHSHPDKPT